MSENKTAQIRGKTPREFLSDIPLGYIHCTYATSWGLSGNWNATDADKSAKQETHNKLATTSCMEEKKNWFCVWFCGDLNVLVHLPAKSRIEIMSKILSVERETRVRENSSFLRRDCQNSWSLISDQGCERK